MTLSMQRSSLERVNEIYSTQAKCLWHIKSLRYDLISQAF